MSGRGNKIVVYPNRRERRGNRRGNSLKRREIGSGPYSLELRARQALAVLHPVPAPTVAPSRATTSLSVSLLKSSMMRDVDFGCVKSIVQ
ncbi:hypothetical protein N7505_003934 [Penicillium chrysogenum]|uniref:Uncharacterized protein n=1 Tax=Penicillium chrysogenum TaxID=5076 RepID=A0ABQ8WST1_PENCH|nr:hypothetical protein N7505_003934 [Penicillium chrysogenum]